MTLFASGDSITSAELVPCCADEFDIIHFHIDLFQFPLFRSLAGRTLTTLHGRQDLPDLKPFYSRFGGMPLVSISNDQRKPLPHANFVSTIHHGLPADLHQPSFGQGTYLAFLGRISPEKRADRAIRIARAAGIPLKIAAKVDKVDEDHFRNIGQIVELEPSLLRSIVPGPYEIRHLIPASDRDPDDPCYRVKSVAEKHDRVVPESQITPSKGAFA